MGDAAANPITRRSRLRIPPPLSADDDGDSAVADGTKSPGPPGLLRLSGERRQLEQRPHPLERTLCEREIGEGAPLLALDEAGVEELLEVVAHRGLLEAEQILEVADAHRLAVRREQAVEEIGRAHV